MELFWGEFCFLSSDFCHRCLAQGLSNASTILFEYKELIVKLKAHSKTMFDLYPCSFSSAVLHMEVKEVWITI